MQIDAVRAVRLHE